MEEIKESLVRASKLLLETVNAAMKEDRFEESFMLIDIKSRVDECKKDLEEKNEKHRYNVHDSCTQSKQ